MGKTQGRAAQKAAEYGLVAGVYCRLGLPTEMPNVLKRKIAWTTILVIALQALLPGFIALSASAFPLDQAVICHSGDPAATPSQPAPQPASAGDCCAQCILCNGLAGGALSHDTGTIVVWSLPSEILFDLLSDELSSALHRADHFARGPPLSA